MHPPAESFTQSGRPLEHLWVRDTTTLDEVDVPDTGIRYT